MRLERSSSPGGACASSGWLVDTLVVGVFGLGLRFVGVTGWPRFLAFEAVVLVDAVVLVAWLGGNVGNLVVGTQVVVAEDRASNRRRPGHDPVERDPVADVPGGARGRGVADRGLVDRRVRADPLHAASARVSTTAPRRSW